MGQLILDLDDRDTWDEQMQNKLHPHPPTGTFIPKEDRIAYLERKAAEYKHKKELLAAGACPWCYGTDFYQGPGGNWLCSKCHPPFGTSVQSWTAYKSDSGQWEVKTVQT